MKSSNDSNLQSYISSESAFSVAENRLDQIEAEVLNQGQVIEKYIQNHSKTTDEPEHFLVLRALYNLFNEEVHLNFQIRKQISDFIPAHKLLVSENQRISEILNGFIRDFNSHFNQSFQNLDEVTQFFLDHIDDSLETEKKYKTFYYSTEKAKNLRSQIEEYEHSIINCHKKISEFKETSSMKLVEINSFIEDNRISCSKLKKQIEIEQQQKEELLHQIKLINDKSSIYMNQIDYQMNDFNKMMNNHKEKQQKRKEKLQKLDNELGESKKKYNCLLQNIDKLKKALIEAQSEKALIESKAKEEIAELAQQKNVFNVLISELLESKSQNLIQKENLSHQKQDIEKKIQLVEKEIDKTEYQITEWKAKLKAKNQMKQYVFDDIDTQTRVLMKIRQESETDDIDSYFALKQKENEILLTENKKLESKLRITLKNIQNIQNENQDLKARILLYSQNNSNNNSIAHEET